jgi:outer membrane protein OmpA-like peptidoglycan-associated protein
MQNFRQFSIVILALLAGIALFVTKCSDPKLQEKITAETIYLNNKHKPNVEHKVNIEPKNHTTNPKTLFVKEEQKASATKVENRTSLEIEKLTKERDEAISIISLLKESNKNLETENSSLREQIDKLVEGANDYSISTKEKIATATTALLAAKQLNTDKDSELQKLTKERDEAIKVALTLKDDYEKLQEQLNNTNEKTQQLIQANKELEKSLQEQKQKYTEIEKRLSETQKNAKVEQSDKTSKLQQKIDKLEKSLKELQSQKSALNKKLTLLEQEQSKNISTTKEKIATATTALLAAKQLNTDKDSELQKLTKERDEAINTSLKVKKDLESSIALKEELEQKLTQCETTTKETLSALESTKQASIKKDKEIETLMKQKNEALQKSKNLELKTKQIELKNKKKMVINEIINTFKLSKVEFKTDSAILTDKSTSLLDKVATIMKKHKEYHYKIQGHTDSQGKEKHNLKLSEDRAKSVKNYLISKGVDETILSSKGFGSSKPIADNKTAKGRLANRRVVFEIEN